MPLLVLIGFACLLLASPAYAESESSYAELLALFADWREFESPPFKEGAPDYTAETFTARQGEFATLRDRLEAFDIAEWPVPQQVDWHLVRAEMNGYDFNARVLKPWARDPAFYKSVWTIAATSRPMKGPPITRSSSCGLMNSR